MTERFVAPDLEKLEEAVSDIAKQMAGAKHRGKPPPYLDEITKWGSDPFGIAVMTREGDVVTGGDADKRFSIQSISKVFALTLALEAFGEKLFKRVGREPSGDPFNSIVDLERHEGIPRNPFINAGALVVADMLLDIEDGMAQANRVEDMIAAHLDAKTVKIDKRILDAETSAVFTNRALANLSKSFGNFHHDVDTALDVYVRQCAISLSARELATAGRYLMLERIDEDAKIDKRTAQRIRRVNALMLTCGQYDGAGDFAYRVGLPAKSGVGGGILAIAPNLATIAVWSPGLDENGNSLLGTRALELLAERMDWSVFGALGDG